MWKIVGREGTASLVVIPALVWKISQENERGARNSPPPPVGRGLSIKTIYHLNRHITSILLVCEMFQKNNLSWKYGFHVRIGI